MHSIKNREKVPKALTRFCQTGLATDDSCEDFSLLGNASQFVITGEQAAGKNRTGPGGVGINRATAEKSTWKLY